MHVDDIKLIMDKRKLDRVVFDYVDVGSLGIMVKCVLHRIYFKHVGATSHAQDEAGALSKAIDILNLVECYEKHFKEPIPQVDVQEQPVNLGYFNKSINEDTVVRYQHVHGKMVVADIFKVTKDGFTVHRSAFPLSEGRHRLDPIGPDNVFVYDGVRYELNSGEQLYAFNDLGPLCGSSGLHVVSGGVVVRSKTLRRA